MILLVRGREAELTWKQNHDTRLCMFVLLFLPRCQNHYTRFIITAVPFWSVCLCLCSVLHVTVTMSCFSGPCSSIQEQRDRWERKRSVTARELVQTEQRYCQQLQLVTTVCIVAVNSTSLTFLKLKEITVWSKGLKSVSNLPLFCSGLVYFMYYILPVSKKVCLN